LSDKAKSLLSRVDLDKSTDYRAIKKYILQEMQLSSSVYLEKFQLVCRDSTETYHHFANKCRHCLNITSKIVNLVAVMTS